MDIVSQRPRNCTSCKLISGAGLIGAGAYVAYHARRNLGAAKQAMNSIAICKYKFCNAVPLPPSHRFCFPSHMKFRVKLTSSSILTGLAGFGTCRLLDLPPFDAPLFAKQKRDIR